MSVRALVALLLTAAVPLAACVPPLPEEALDRNGRGGAAGTGAGGTGGAAGTDGSTPPPFVVLVDGAGSPANLALDGKFVYWARRDLLRVPIEGGAPSPLADLPGSGGAWVAVAGGAAFVAVDVGGSTDIVRVGLDGASPTLFFHSAAPINQLTASADGVFWTTLDGAVMKLALTGGMPATLAVGQYNPGPIAVDAAAVYWVTADGTAMKTGLSGGSPVTLSPWLPGQPDLPMVPYTLLPTMAVNTTNVFWGRLNGTIAKVGRNGGQAAHALIYPNSRKAASVAADDTGIYYGDMFGAVHIVHFAAPDTEWILGDGGGPASYVATDATSVYWIVGDRILKAPK